MAIVLPNLRGTSVFRATTVKRVTCTRSHGRVERKWPDLELDYHLFLVFIFGILFSPLTRVEFIFFSCGVMFFLCHGMFIVIS